MEVKVELFHKKHNELWNNFVANAKNATFLFHRDFMEYHKDRFKDYSLMVFKNNKVIAVLPANLNNDVLYSHQGLTYGGLILDSNIKFQGVVTIFKSILEWLSDKGISTINLKTLPGIYAEVPSDEMLYLMFLLNAQLYRRDALSVINLKTPVPFSKNRVEGCKRAKKHELKIEEVETFDTFWNSILIPNLSEKHDAVPVHSLEEITQLKQKFPKNIRQFNVCYKNEIVAGATIFETKTVAHAQYISGNHLKNTIGSLDFLHAHLIQDVFKNKAYFDFGISSEQQGRNINQGLQYWKEGFGARTIIQDFYTIETKSFTALNTIWI
ncbi:hypothetical protein [Formosa haliotis]|uniref:hypothetical protein n=1 Tax=Formosa haliotis TaxID=1555194 RepID=UPI000824AA48|nr:hypothetical protein [Formosa haliotis]